MEHTRSATAVPAETDPSGRPTRADEQQPPPVDTEPPDSETLARRRAFYHAQMRDRKLAREAPPVMPDDTDRHPF